MAYIRQENCWKCGEYYFTQDEPYTTPLDEHINARCPKCKYDPAKTNVRVDRNEDGGFTATFWVKPTKPLEYVEVTFVDQPTD